MSEASNAVVNVSQQVGSTSDLGLLGDLLYADNRLVVLHIFDWIYLDLVLLATLYTQESVFSSCYSCNAVVNVVLLFSIVVFSSHRIFFFH